MFNSVRFSLRTGCPLNLSNHFFGMPVIRMTRGSRVEMGKNIVALSKARFNEIGVIQPVMFSLVTEHAVIRIGDGVGLSGCTLSARTNVEIGAGTMIGSGALIMDHDAHPLTSSSTEVASRPVRIGLRVFIGARAIILKGVNIGADAVIGAGAVVTKDVPAGAVAAGNPARIVRTAYSTSSTSGHEE